MNGWTPPFSPFSVPSMITCTSSDTIFMTM